MATCWLRGLNGAERKFIFCMVFRMIGWIQGVAPVGGVLGLLSFTTDCSHTTAPLEVAVS